MNFLNKLFGKKKTSEQPIDHAEAKKNSYQSASNVDATLLEKSVNRKDFIENDNKREHYYSLADELANFHSFRIGDPKIKELESKLLEGGDKALYAIRDYLLAISSSLTVRPYVYKLVELIKSFPNDREIVLESIISQPSNIWEYDRDVKKIAQEELNKLQQPKEEIKSEEETEISENNQLIPCLTEEPNFPDNFTEVSFRDEGLNQSIKINRDGVYLGFVHIPFSKIVDVKWQPILRPEIAIGGWVKIITPDNPLCPVRKGSWFIIPGDTEERVEKIKKLYPEYFYGTQKLYPQDNCLWYNAVHGSDEADKKDAEIKKIINLIRQIIKLDK